MDSPRTRARDAAALQRRASLVQQFFETLVVMKHRGDRTAFATNLARRQWGFVTEDEVRLVLESMMETELSKEEGCKEAFELLDEGVFEIGPKNYVQLKQIAKDTLQFSFHAVRIQTADAMSEGIPGMPYPLSRQTSSDEATRTCWVGGLVSGTTPEALSDALSMFGGVESVSIRDKGPHAGNTGHGANSWAFVRFLGAPAAANAVRETLTTPVMLDGVELSIQPVDTEMLEARKAESGMVGASAAVWGAARGR
jgi:hypothetical protein